MKFRRVLLVVVLLVPIASRAQTLLPNVQASEGDFRGRVVDRDTAQPIEGAVVVANWNMYTLGVAPFFNSKLALLRVTETVTDQAGRFVIPNLGREGPLPGWSKDPSAYPGFMVYKAGYALYLGDQGSWTARVDNYGRPLVPPDIAARYANDPGIILPLYEYSKDPNVRSSEDRTRLNSARRAASYLKGNVDLVDLSHASAEARNAIQAQIHAFIAVADEIERLTNKKSNWNDVGQINRAIEDARSEGARK